jgi:CheY-like chemotaxis protein
MEKKRILIIDEESAFTRLVKLNLEKTGRYSVRTANQSRQALAVAGEFAPHLVLLDIAQPGLDEEDFTARLRAAPELQGIPIVFVTDIIAKTQPDTTGHLLAKPVSLAKLIDCIERNLCPLSLTCPSTSLPAP